MFTAIKKIIHLMRGHSCTNCAHWVKHAFAVGDCGRKKFLVLGDCGYVGTNEVCCHWIPNLVYKGKRLMPHQVEFILKKAKENGFGKGVPMNKMDEWITESEASK